MWGWMLEWVMRDCSSSRGSEGEMEEWSSRARISS